MAAAFPTAFFFFQRNFFCVGSTRSIGAARFPRRPLAAREIDPSKPLIPVEIAPCESIASNYEGSCESPRRGRVRNLKKWNRAFKYNRFLNQRTYLTGAGSRPLDALDCVLLASMFRSRPAFRARRLRLNKQWLFHRGERGRKHFWTRGRRVIRAHLRCLRSNASCTAD